MFSKKATKNYKIFTVDLTLIISKRQTTNSEDFIIFRGLLRKHELNIVFYQKSKCVNQVDKLSNLVVIEKIMRRSYDK